MAPVEGAVLVSDGQITVKVSLTSPLLREPGIFVVLQVYFILFSHIAIKKIFIFFFILMIFFSC